MNEENRVDDEGPPPQEEYDSSRYATGAPSEESSVWGDLSPDNPVHYSPSTRMQEPPKRPVEGGPLRPQPKAQYDEEESSVSADPDPGVTSTMDPEEISRPSGSPDAASGDPLVDILTPSGSGGDPRGITENVPVPPAAPDGEPEPVSVKDKLPQHLKDKLVEGFKDEKADNYEEQAEFILGIVDKKVNGQDLDDVDFARLATSVYGTSKTEAQNRLAAANLTQDEIDRVIAEAKLPDEKDEKDKTDEEKAEDKKKEAESAQLKEELLPQLEEIEKTEVPNLTLDESKAKVQTRIEMLKEQIKDKGWMLTKVTMSILLLTLYAYIATLAAVGKNAGSR